MNNGTTKVLQTLCVCLFLSILIISISSCESRRSEAFETTKQIKYNLMSRYDICLERCDGMYLTKSSKEDCYLVRCENLHNSTFREDK